MNRVFTFFYTDGCELQTLEPLANEIASRGHEILMTSNMQESADVGIYCSHAVKPNAKFSVIMLHDLAQRHDVWPSFWNHEPWDKFDLGILPGNAWEERWLSQRRLSCARPKLGVYKAGWPKSDLIFKNQSDFTIEIARLKNELNLKYEKTILYAPSWENNSKQDEFVQTLKDLPVNLLLKQAPWSDNYGWVLKNIEVMNELHRGLADNIHIVDRDISIMYCIGLSDLLVSDESSVLIEASLYDVPSVAIIDWLIPDRNPPRPACVPFENVKKISKSQLHSTVEDLLAKKWHGKEAACLLKNHHFSQLGHSSKLCADLVMAGLSNSPMPISPIDEGLTSLAELDAQDYITAVMSIENGELEKGIDLLKSLVIQKTGCWQVYNDLGVLSFQKGDLNSAAKYLREACKLNTSNITSELNFASVLLKSNNTNLAIEVLGDLIEKNPYNTDVIDALGESLNLPHDVWGKLLKSIRQSA